MLTLLTSYIIKFRFLSSILFMTYIIVKLNISPFHILFVDMVRSIDYISFFLFNTIIKLPYFYILYKFQHLFILDNIHNLIWLLFILTGIIPVIDI